MTTAITEKRMNDINACYVMMTSSHGNNFRVTGPLWGESTVNRWLPLKKASDAELWCVLWSAPEQMFEYVSLVRLDTIEFIMTSL